MPRACVSCSICHLTCSEAELIAGPKSNVPLWITPQVRHLDAEDLLHMIELPDLQGNRKYIDLYLMDWPYNILDRAANAHDVLTDGKDRCVFSYIDIEKMFAVIEGCINTLAEDGVILAFCSFQ